LNDPRLTIAVSRKTHGAAGTFDIPLPLSGEPGVECRSTGGAHTLVFTFSNNVVSGNAAVTSGIGSVAGSPTFAGNTMTVNLSGATDVQKIKSGVPVSAANFREDVAVSGSINASDIALVKSRSGASAP
jgi:hypothetical protein